MCQGGGQGGLGGYQDRSNLQRRGGQADFGEILAQISFRTEGGFKSRLGRNMYV